MKMKKLGRTDLLVSELCLGTMHFGWRNTERAAAEILDAFDEGGGNFLQGVAMHPGWIDGGSFAADIVGRWLRGGSGRRDAMVLSVRLAFGRAAGAGSPAAGTVRVACESALRRIGTDRIDLLVLDWCDCVEMRGDLRSVLAGLVAAGMVRHIGVANFPVRRIRGTVGCEAATLQAEFSLLGGPQACDDEITLGAKSGLGFLAVSPLADGYLAGIGRAGREAVTERLRRLQRRHDDERGRAVAAALEAAARERGVPAAQLAHAWVLGDPRVTASIIGVGSTAQLHDAVAATALQLTDDERRWLFGGGRHHATDGAAADNQRHPAVFTPRQSENSNLVTLLS